MGKLTVKMLGPMGKALQLSMSNRLKTVDYDLLVQPFKLRNETDNAWRCEFWGKIVRSAILTNYYCQDKKLAEMIEKTVRDIMATQSANGCISSYPQEKQLNEWWDIWGRKYVILGLLRYYDLIEAKKEVKECCCHVLDHLMTQVGPGKVDILDCGQHDGLAASSILGAVVGVYRISGALKYLDFAHYIIKRGCSKKRNIFDAVLAGVLPADLGNGKAYEMTSCFQGLAELNQLTPNAEYQEICKKYFAVVRDHEIFITGIGGLKDAVGEFWYNGTKNQTKNDVGGLGETCVTVTWLHYCERIMEMTQKQFAVDAAERSFYNALLGAMGQDGTSWVHTNPTPLTGGGYKKPALDQIFKCFRIPYGGNDCCRAQGPEGLALAPRFAVRKLGDAIALNLFEPLDAELDDIKMEVRGNYPYKPEAVVKIVSKKAFNLLIRTPKFLKKVQLNGKNIPFDSGKYLEISRAWKDTDKLELLFDFSLQEIPSPAGDGYVAVMRGPLVLATDSRGAALPAPICEKWHERTLIDYATAGNEMTPKNTLAVWLKKEQ